MGATAKTIGRRLFARATVGVPLALKGTVNVSNSANMYPPPVSLGAAAGIASPADVAKYAMREKVYQRLRVDMRPEEELNAVRWTRRNALGGLDPDLSVLNSMSVVRRIQIQIDRDREANEKARSIRSRIIRMMGGNPEDFD